MLVHPERLTRLHDVASDTLTLAGVEDDVDLGSESRYDHACRVAIAVRRRIVLVEVGVPAAKVLAESARRGMQVVEAGSRVTGVLERVDDIGRDEHERPGGSRERSLAERECELTCENDEAVGVMVVDMGTRSLLARRVDGLGDGELLGIHDQHHVVLRARVDDLARLSGALHPRAA